MKLTTDKINQLLGIDDPWKAPDRLMEILFDRKRREQLFRSFLKIESDVSYDWFYQYFQDEAADRRKKKQDFTPVSVGQVLSALTDHDKGNNYDCACGTGGLTIQKWQYDRMQFTPFDYYPSDHFYTCEDLSDRAIPFLLFNLLIRGMNACVVHCDVLSRKAKGAFFVQNDRDDHLAFSSLNVLPYTDTNARLLDVTWEDKYYPEHIESKETPLHLAYYAAYEAEKKRVKEAIAKLKKILSQSIKKVTPYDP